MNVQEYLENDLPFYHLTSVRNKDSILENGLSRNGNSQGICVVRSDDDRVLHLIAQQIIKLDKEFCLFRIVPSVHELRVEDINCDITSEFSNPLHSYIEVDELIVSELDIRKYYSYNDVLDDTILKNQLTADGIIIALEYPGSRKWTNYLENLQLEDLFR